MPIEGHFICQIGNNYYDYNGIVNEQRLIKAISFKEIKKNDELWYKRLVRDCIE